ncbi:hypothetical protein CW732_08035 [Olleya sp. Bg11-27]|nr:hypothetical protein CW732_08035 [Olleya sp. Bg11-27]
MEPLKGNIIVPSIALTLITVSIIISFFTTNVINNKHLLGFLLLLISNLLFFKNKKWYVLTFLSSSVLGLINLIDVFYINIKITVFGLSFNLLFLILLIAFLYTNKTLINQVFPEKK